MASKGVLIDTGPLVAILSERDQYHESCREEAKSLRGPFYTCWPVITEAAYLLKERDEEVAKLLERVRSAKIRLLHLDLNDIVGISRVLTQYADQDFDLADAAMMYLADREGIESVFTIDHRHFSVYRTLRGKALSVLPACS